MSTPAIKLIPPRNTPAAMGSVTPAAPQGMHGTAARTRRQSLLVLADLSCILSGAILAIALRFPDTIANSPASLTLAGHLGISFLYAVLITLFCHTHNLYTVHLPVTRFQELLAIAKSIAMATVLLGGTLFVSGSHRASRLVIGFTAVYALLTMLGWRTFRRWTLGKAVADGLSCHNVLIIGTDATALAVADHLTTHRQLGFIVVGHLGTQLPGPPAGQAPNVLGRTEDLKTLCRQHFADEVIICTHHRPTVLQAIADATECGLGVRVIPDLYDGLALGASVSQLGGFPVLTVVHRSIPAIAMKLKRALDIAVSASALTLLSPLLLLLSLVVKLDSKGPVLYSSRRLGKKGRPFHCHKFRSMVTDAEKRKAELSHLNERDGVLFKIANDPRITRSGRFMRKYSLDELPQLWNVLKGDMSLVGPRPPLASEVKQYQLEYLRRLEAAPGITGLWQVQARNHPSFDRYISLDLHYVENWTFALDLHILLRTIAVVFAGTGS